MTVHPPAMPVPQPLVSVVVPTYNRAPVLARALASVRAQTWPAWELLVIDDASTDDTVAWVRSHADPRIRLVSLPVRKGAAAARNAGAREARGDWVAFLDSDDEWLPERLRRQMDALRTASPETAVGYCPVWVDENRSRTMSQSQLGSGNVLDALLDGKRPPTASAFVVRRDAFLQVGGFDEEMPSAHDIDCWLRLAQAGWQYQALAEPLVIHYREAGQSRISTDAHALWLGLNAFETRWGRVMRQRIGLRRYRRRRFMRLHSVLRVQWNTLTAPGQALRARLGALGVWLRCLPELLWLRVYLRAIQHAPSLRQRPGAE